MLALLIWSAASVKAQVGIGGSEDPKPGAVLDLSQVSAQNLGLLLPRAALTHLVTTWDLPGSAAANAADGMLVYVKRSAGIDVASGIYLWYNNKWNLIVKTEN